MPLDNKLRLVMANNRINNISELIAITGVSRNSLNKLWHNENVESIKVATLVQICDSLNIDLSELLSYTPESSSEGRSSTESWISAFGTKIRQKVNNHFGWILLFLLKFRIRHFWQVLANTGIRWFSLINFCPISFNIIWNWFEKGNKARQI